MPCPRCHQENATTQKFCGKCGSDSGSRGGRMRSGVRPINVPDVTAAFRFVAGQREMGFRSVLFAPMLREGVGLGAIGVSHRSWRTRSIF